MAPLHPQALVAYAGMDVLNPFSLETVGRLLDMAEPRPGWRTVDLGCGNGAVSAWVAQRYGLTVDAVERQPEMAAMARARTGGLTGAGRVVVHEIDGTEHLDAAGPLDLLLALGVSGVVPGPPRPTEVLAALRGRLKPGGWLLWGDPFWRKEPSPQFVALLGASQAYETHAGNIAAGEAAGLETWWAAVSTDQDWEDYSWRNNLATRRWLAANPNHPDAAVVAGRAQMMRTVWLMEGRETLGAALYLFRNPPA